LALWFISNTGNIFALLHHLYCNGKYPKTNLSSLLDDLSYRAIHNRLVLDISHAFGSLFQGCDEVEYVFSRENFFVSGFICIDTYQYYFNHRLTHT